MVFFITVTFMVVEFVGGVASGSLALVSDAVHMLTDSAALGLGYFAAAMGRRRGSAEKSYGFRRAEVLAALINGLALWVLSGFIISEAFSRFNAPAQINTGLMLWVGVAGLLVNIAGAMLLHRSSTESINARAAFLHVLADLLGSVGVVVAGIVIRFTGWRIIDPLISLFIVALILYSSWHLLSDAVHILMEGTPERINHEAVRSALLAVEGVKNVHELHIWTLTEGFEAVSVHIIAADDAARGAVLEKASALLHERFGLTHSTVQVETAGECQAHNGSCYNG